VAFEPITIGEPGTLLESDTGCRFRQRCWLAEPDCFTTYPTLTGRPGGVTARCHVSERSPAHWFTRSQPAQVGEN
jgi:ABC-type dipeptide/oligopeptide/nickel transport system ATPase component